MMCANPGCGNEFDKTAHNQKYCGPECLREATNRRFREKYREEKERRKSTDRRCSYCSSGLSKYNKTDVCSSCEARRRADRTKRLRYLTDVISESP
jgi:hypothetical protein